MCKRKCIASVLRWFFSAEERIQTKALLCSIAACIDIDGFHSIFHHRNWRAKGSCDVDFDQSAGSMVM